MSVVSHFGSSSGAGEPSTPSTNSVSSTPRTGATSFGLHLSVDPLQRQQQQQQQIRPSSHPHLPSLTEQPISGYSASFDSASSSTIRGEGGGGGGGGGGSNSSGGTFSDVSMSGMGGGTGGSGHGVAAGNTTRGFMFGQA